MKDRIKTLVLVSNGVGLVAAVSDTLIEGLLGRTDSAPASPFFERIPLLRRIMRRSRNEAISYMIDWCEALCESPALDIEVCNINNYVDYRKRREAISRFPLIIILHSAAGDSMSILQKTAHWFEHRLGKLVMFIGNEYDLMAEKLKFIRIVGADYVCTQLPIEVGKWLYAECTTAEVLEMPHALNPKLYYPYPYTKRTSDIAFIGARYPHFIGDMERNNLIYYFQTHGSDLGLKCDMHIGKNIPRKEWSVFLNSCYGIIGAEAGTYYLDRKGKILNDAKVYSKINPNANFDQLFDIFFRKPQVEHLSGKCISSRHFESIGTKTCQLLLKGDYNGILLADNHYIGIKKDLSNVEDAVERFKDVTYRSTLIERAYEYVMDVHTYRHRVESLVKAVEEGTPQPTVA